MRIIEEFNQLARMLEVNGVRYAIAGGMAMALHGLVRATEDMDVLLHPADAEKLVAALRSAGYLEKTTAWSFRSSGLTLRRLIRPEPGTESFAMVDLLLADDPAVQVMLARAETVPWGGGSVSVLARADLVELKRRANRPVDQSDVRRLEHGHD